MQIPVSEAFQENERSEVTLELEPEQLRWLRDRSAENDVSPDQIVRYLINRQMRAGDDVTSIQDAFEDADPPVDADEDDGTDTSVLDELRDASNMLDDLTADEDDESASTSINTPSSPASSDASPSSPEPSESKSNKSTSPPSASGESASGESASSDTGSRPKDFLPNNLESSDGAPLDDASDEDEPSPSKPASMFEMVDDDHDDEQNDTS